MGLTRAMLEQLELIVGPVRDQVVNTISRGVVQIAASSGLLQKLQVGVLDGEDVDDVEHFEPYGFSSVPLEGAEALLVFPGGDRGHPIAVVVTDRRHRPTGKDPGTVTVYNEAGALVELTPDGDIVLTPKSGRKILLGSASSSDPVALKSDLDALKSVISGWTPTGGDGGAALNTAITTTPGWTPAGSATADSE